MFLCDINMIKSLHKHFSGDNRPSLSTEEARANLLVSTDAAAVAERQFNKTFTNIDSNTDDNKPSYYAQCFLTMLIRIFPIAAMASSGHYRPLLEKEYILLLKKVLVHCVWGTG